MKALATQPTDQIEAKKGGSAKFRFHVSSEHPKEPHIADQMPPSGVEEHCGECRGPVRVCRYKPVRRCKGVGGMMERRPNLNSCIHKNQTAERPPRGNRSVIFVEGKNEHCS